MEKKHITGGIIHHMEHILRLANDIEELLSASVVGIAHCVVDATQAQTPYAETPDAAEPETPDGADAETPYAPECFDLFKNLRIDKEAESSESVTAGETESSPCRMFNYMSEEKEKDKKGNGVKGGTSLRKGFLNKTKVKSNPKSTTGKSTPGGATSEEIAAASAISYDVVQHQERIFEQYAGCSTGCNENISRATSSGEAQGEQEQVEQVEESKLSKKTRGRRKRAKAQKAQQGEEQQEPQGEKKRTIGEDEEENNRKEVAGAPEDMIHETTTTETTAQENQAAQAVLVEKLLNIGDLPCCVICMEPLWDEDGKVLENLQFCAASAPKEKTLMARVRTELQHGERDVLKIVGATRKKVSSVGLPQGYLTPENFTEKVRYFTSDEALEFLDRGRMRAEAESAEAAETLGNERSELPPFEWLYLEDSEGKASEGLGISLFQEKACVAHISVGKGEDVVSHLASEGVLQKIFPNSAMHTECFCGGLVPDIAVGNVRVPGEEPTLKGYAACQHLMDHCAARYATDEGFGLKYFDLSPLGAVQGRLNVKHASEVVAKEGVMDPCIQMLAEPKYGSPYSGMIAKCPSCRSWMDLEVAPRNFQRFVSDFHFARAMLENRPILRTDGTKIGQDARNYNMRYKLSGIPEKEGEEKRRAEEHRKSVEQQKTRSQKKKKKNSLNS